MLRKSIRAGMLKVRYSVCDFMMTGLPRDRKRGTETTSISFTGGARKRRQPFLLKPRDSGEKIRAQVLEPAVAGEKCDCGPGLPLGKQSPGRGKMSTRGETGEDTLLGRKVAGCGDRLLVGHRYIACGQSLVEQLKIGSRITGSLDAAPRVAHAASAQHRGAGRFDGVRSDCGVEASQRPGHPGERAARSDHVHEDVDLSLGLCPELRPRMPLMGQNVAFAPELIDAEGAAPRHDLRRKAKGTFLLLVADASVRLVVSHIISLTP